MSDELSDEQLTKLAAMISSSIEKKGMCISFDEKTRETLHTLHRARVEAGAEHGDIVLAFQIGKNLNDTIGDSLKNILKAIVIIGALILAFLGLKAWGVLGILKGVT